MSESQLTLREVNRRLDICQDAVAEEFYSFGLLMLREIDERFEYLDRKAMHVAAFCGAVVALVISSVGSWPRAVDPNVIPVVLFAAVFFLTAAGVALSATWVSNAVWFSPDDWLRADFLAHPKDLKRYWIEVMYVVRESYFKECERKVSRIELAWYPVCVAAGMLLVALLDAALRAPTLLHGFGIR